MSLKLTSSLSEFRHFLSNRLSKNRFRAPAEVRIRFHFVFSFNTARRKLTRTVERQHRSKVLRKLNGIFALAGRSSGTGFSGPRATISWSDYQRRRTSSALAAAPRSLKAR